ncbi:ATP-binding protein [Kamptonema cortianum]|uniref:ATP-binding protein n=1 Tax=Geitlerinema calcuttense NRMC-F 0142 TaxID=2922238 RepID=A0ABT7M036_9CYAN|nr:ATP-binding protein [Geitlerinema calcuttense]MDK3160126.1 ATP-binding protein [Kamptonema cortianum]MDL5057624.1 ATP-binding protein [Geitlerinema calcuttense NRMC-F 0142]
MPDTNQPRLLSFTLDGWTALGGRVSVSLRDRVGVLVGRNGAGKSAILEGFDAISSSAIGRLNPFRFFDSESIPKILEIEVLTPTERRLGYRYELIFFPHSTDNTDIDESTSDSSEESQFSWNESCQYLDENKEVLWTTEAGVTTLRQGDEPVITILGNTSSLRQAHLPENARLKLPDEMRWIRAILRGVRLLGKIPIRQTSRRRPSLIRVSGRGMMASGSLGLVDNLARKILRLLDTEELSELEKVCQRVGLGSKITEQKFVLSESSKEKVRGEGDEYLSSVLIDGINLGLLSDGTLRVLSILLEIISSYPSATTIIEEPETQIHPGMLDKLLNEIEAYTFDGNLILSTHSPQVVAWTSPDKLNLVYRNQGRTNIRKLQEEEIRKVVEYLDEQGDLGDWLYSGILDE